MASLDHTALGWGSKAQGAQGYEGWMSQDKWDPKSDAGASKWQNWAGKASTADKNEYAGKMGQSWNDLNSVISGLGSANNTTRPLVPVDTNGNPSTTRPLVPVDTNGKPSTTGVIAPAVTAPAVTAPAVTADPTVNTGDGLQLWNPNAFPWSESNNNSNSLSNTSSNSVSNNTSNSVSNNVSNSNMVSDSYSNSESGSQNSSQATSSGDSYGGLDYDNTTVKSLLDQFQRSAGNYENNVDQGMLAARDLAEASARRGVRTNMAPAIDKLASMGVLQSSVGEGALGSVLGQIQQNAQQQAYMSGIEGAKLKAALPDILTRMTQANRMSEAQNQSQSTSEGSSYGFTNSAAHSDSQSNAVGSSVSNSLGNSVSNSLGTSMAESLGSSWSEDKSAPYSDLMNLYLGLGARS